MEADAAGTRFNVASIVGEPLPIGDLEYNVTTIGADGTRDWSRGVHARLEDVRNAPEESRFRFVDNGMSGYVDPGDEFHVGGSGPYDVEIWNATTNIGGTWRCI